MQRFSDILFVASPGADDAAAFERTLRLAEAHQARLTIVDLQRDARLPPIDAPDGVTSELLHSALGDASAEVLRGYEEAAGDRVALETETLIGVGFVEVIRRVLRRGHDLVVKAVEGAQPYRHRLFGSLDMHLLRKCPVPVWLARPGTGEHHYRRLLAAIDFDPHAPDADGDSLNRRVLEAAAGQALADSAELHLVHAWQAAHEGLLRSRGVFASETQAQHYIETQQALHQSGLERIDARFREWIGDEAHAWLAPQLHLREGGAADVIPGAATELAADLVVMGTVGRTGIAGLLIGNTAETILERIDASVLALKPPGFETPVETD